MFICACIRQLLVGYLSRKMYDRAPRALTQASGGTGGLVGPGTYEALEVGRKNNGEATKMN